MNLFKSIALSLCLLCSGCISIIEHAGNEVYYPYNPTVEESKMLGVWWHVPQNANEQIGMDWVKITYLVWVVDFPFEVVSDTICLPYDIFYHNNKSN